VRYAKRGTLINYEPLARLFGLNLQNVVDRNRLSAMLGMISTYEYRKHGFMLSAIVVKMENGRPGSDPGSGFWTCAADLGIFDPDVDDPLTFHMDQVAKVHGHSASSQSSRSTRAWLGGVSTSRCCRRRSSTRSTAR
jgi:hypothetical protein